MPNSRDLAFFNVVWHEKMLFGMYVITWRVLGFFNGVGRKSAVWHFKLVSFEVKL